MSKKLAPLPKSRAKTAYGLLSEVRQAILAEPKRYNQGLWLARVADGSVDPDEAPRCGTIGCVAGWVATLTSVDQTFEPRTCEETAGKVLGIDARQMMELFTNDALEGRTSASPGTARYANAGAAHIARFQKKYAKQLKAKAIKHDRQS